MLKSEKYQFGCLVRCLRLRFSISLWPVPMPELSRDGVTLLPEDWMLD